MSMHRHTPQLQVIDPKGNSVREVAYCRVVQDEQAQERVTRYVHDAAGRQVADWDPRLGIKASLANTTVIPSLAGAALLENSVDAGWRLTLPGADGQSLDSWDSRGSHSRIDYDPLLRPISVTETPSAGPASVVERFSYGDASALHNQCGRLVRHDDPAGTLGFIAFGLLGTALVQNRRFLETEQTPDWPLDLAQREALLEPGAGYTSATAYDAATALISQTDAVGNHSVRLYGVGGLLLETRLQLAGATTSESLTRDIRYTATGQVESERLGNGVVTANTYEPDTGRLSRTLGKAANGVPLQDLNYDYDPAGNLLEIEDAAQPTRFFANQVIEPISRYRYDSLYQLIEATGREVSTGASHGPALPEMQNLPPDPSQMSNYSQSYRYDSGGNLLEMRHVGAQSFTRTMLVAPDSNRSLPEGETDADFRSGFDANGNLQALVRGQAMDWDLRNQLRQITAVQREDGSSDDELYAYDGGGQRCRKIRRAQASGNALVSDVRYLPGLEIRSQAGGEVLYVASTQAGRSSIRIMHWAAKKPEGIENDQVRYTLSDHLGSSTLELDKQGGLISQEGYYPFGGTAWWAARSAVEAKYKTVRYSGKERDASGLYYYGFRYYAPWLFRWVNPDPSGGLDGLNLFRALRNNPLAYVDPDGRMAERDDGGVPKQPVIDYFKLAAAGYISLWQARAMTSVRKHWTRKEQTEGAPPKEVAFRDGIADAIRVLSARGYTGVRLTTYAHILAAVWAETSQTTGEVLYGLGEVAAASLNYVGGESAASAVVGPLSDIFNSPTASQEDLDKNRHLVSSSVKFLGKAALHTPHKLVRAVGALGLATGNAMETTEGAAAAMYKNLRRVESAPLIRNTSHTSLASLPGSPLSPFADSGDRWSFELESLSSASSSSSVNLDPLREAFFALSMTPDEPPALVAFAPEGFKAKSRTSRGSISRSNFTA